MLTVSATVRLLRGREGAARSGRPLTAGDRAQLWRRVGSTSSHRQALAQMGV